MNCAQTRRHVLTDPNRLSEAVQMHIASCPACLQFLHAQRHQQSLIASAVARTPAPKIHPPLHAYADAANGASVAPARRKFFAMAASVAVGATGVVGAGMWWRQGAPSPEDSRWAAVVMQHFQEDPTHLLPPDPLAPNRAEALLTQLGARKLAALPPVIQSGLCQLLDCEAAHLVVNWQGQRVVVFLMPRKGRRVVPIAVDGWQGELRPLVGGMVAALAQQPQAALAVADALASAVAWSA